jgi:hypothetical protein
LDFRGNADDRAPEMRLGSVRRDFVYLRK